MITLQTAEQTWGDSALEVIKKYGTKTALSDLAIAQGGVLGGDSLRTSDNLRAGHIWSASSSEDGSVRVVGSHGDKDWKYPLTANPPRAPLYPPISHL